MHISILEEGLQDNIVVQRLADFVKFDGLALVERVCDTVRVLALTNLAVERLPRVSDNLFVTGDPHDVPSRQPSFEAKEMDYRLGPCTFTGADQRVLLCLIIREAESTHVVRRAVAMRLFGDVDAERLLKVALQIVEVGSRRVRGIIIS